jgi:uncharacterized protein (DUF983 family)
VTLAGRALALRCPRCGAGGAVRGLVMAEVCRGCGLRFEREPGYWIGAMIIDTAVTFATFLLVFVGGMVLTWPDVPWTGLLVGTIAVNAVVPVVFYPWAKTLWAAMELSWHPLEPTEIEAADSRAPS